MTQTAILILICAAAANATPILTFTTESDPPPTWAATTGDYDLELYQVGIDLDQPTDDVSLFWGGTSLGTQDCAMLCAFFGNPLFLPRDTTQDVFVTGTAGMVSLDSVLVSGADLGTRVWVAGPSQPFPESNTPEPGSALMLLSGVMLCGIGKLGRYLRD